MAALEQPGVSVEVILVDDGSTDGTRQMLAAMSKADSRIKVLETEINGGPSQARNLGVAAATGDWIAFADSDDLMLPGRLARLARLGEASKADFVADQQMETIYPSATGGIPAFTGMGPEEAAPVSLADYLRLAREGNPHIENPPIRRSFGQLKPFVRKSFLDGAQLEHDVRFRNGEDLHFQVRCLMAGATMIFVNEPGYVYRRRVDSLTYEDDLSYFRLGEVDDDLQLQPLDPASRRYLNKLTNVWRGHAAYQAMRQALRRRHYRVALAWLGRAGVGGVAKALSTPLRRAVRRLRRRR